MNLILIILTYYSIISANLPKEHTQIKSYFRKSITLIKHFETFKSEPYELNNKFYNGYGFLILEPANISKDDANKLLIDKFTNLHNEIKKDVYNEKKAYLLTLIAYNIGLYKLKSYDIYKKANVKKYNFDIDYLNINKFNGKIHKGLNDRRLKELNTINKNNC